MNAARVLGGVLEMRTGLLYLMLVGFPVLALVGVIRIGERITPPPFLGGTWRFTEVTAAPATTGCVPPQAWPQELEIIQSGVVMDLVFHGPPRVRTGAILRGEILRASLPTGGSGCGTEWVMEARIEGPAGSERLSGKWTPVDCDACTPRHFTANRSATPAIPHR